MIHLDFWPFGGHCSGAFPISIGVSESVRGYCLHTSQCLADAVGVGQCWCRRQLSVGMSVGKIAQIRWHMMTNSEKLRSASYRIPLTKILSESSEGPLKWLLGSVTNGSLAVLWLGSKDNCRLSS